MTTQLVTLTIDGIKVAQDTDGLYSVNDLYKASTTTEKKHQPKRWLQLVRTKALIKELESDSFMDGNSVHKTSGKAGTFVCTELVYSYAMHISPKFEIQVIRAFHKSAQKKLRQATRMAEGRYLQDRQNGIHHHRDMTDRLKDFVEYARDQGSKSSNMYYMVISKCINKALSIEDRDDVDADELLALSMAEVITERVLKAAMKESTPYKDAYREVDTAMKAYKMLTQGETN